MQATPPPRLKQLAEIRGNPILFWLLMPLWGPIALAIGHLYTVNSVNGS